MAEQKTLIWLHRRHADHPELQVGFRWVTEEVAEKLIREECAQSRHTDSRRLRHVTTEIKEPEPKPKPKRRRGRPRKTPEPAPVAEETAPEPSVADTEEATEAGRYTRRDMRAEE